MYLSNLLFIKFWKLLVSYLGCVWITFDIATQTTWSHLLTMLMNKNLECRDQNIYLEMLRKICTEGVKFQFYQSHKKLIFWSTFAIYMVQTLLKILRVTISFTLLRTSRANLSCKTWNISSFSLLVNYNLITQIAFFWQGFYYFCTGLFSWLIKVLSVFHHNLFLLEPHCFIFLLNFITSIYRRII